MTILVPPNNALFEELHKSTKSKQKRRLNKECVTVSVIDGVKYCAWCAVNPVEKGRQKYCSKSCVDSSTIYLDPACDLSIQYHVARQNLACNLCGYSFTEGSRLRLERLIEIYGKNSVRIKWFLELKPEEQVMRGYHLLPEDRKIEMDHILPVAAGGDVLTVDNIQAICKDCHKSKTVIDHKLIREFKKKKIDHL